MIFPMILSINLIFFLICTFLPNNMNFINFMCEIVRAMGYPYWVYGSYTVETIYFSPPGRFWTTYMLQKVYSTSSVLSSRV